MRELTVMKPAHRRHYDFSRPLDDSWEVIPEKGWTFDLSPHRARFVNRSAQCAEVYLRPCCIEGDSVKFQLKHGAPKKGIFVFGFLGGFEFITVKLNLAMGDLRIETHEFHKRQPRFEGRVKVPASRIEMIRNRDRLPGLPYSGSSLRLRFDGRTVAFLRQIDFLPECCFMMGLQGPGEISLASFSIEGPPRPRPEYVHVGVWQQSEKSTTVENVNGLIQGVRKAACAGVQVLVTPETSLTGCRPDDPELNDRDLIQSELHRFQEVVSRIRGAPYTLIGYPEWVSGSKVEGATLPWVKLNCHRFVRPDGTLGPFMAKVHSCENGLWHGRKYNLQRVCGVEVAVGICHDARYPDVWSTGVMGGARLCIHASGAAGPRGTVAEFLNSIRKAGGDLDAYWVCVNSGGGSAIVYPCRNRKFPETILAAPPDLMKRAAQTRYQPMDQVLAHARIRLWDACGAFPMRTLRAGRRAYKIWSSLIPAIQEV
jgi:predicted amidohydrolase